MIKYFLALTFSIILSYGEIRAQDSTMGPPTANGPVKIHVSIIINDISEINAASQLMKADIFLMVNWNDPRLKHDGKKKVSLKNIANAWGPLLTISNRLNISKSFEEDINVAGDGTVSYFQRIYGDFTQDFHFKEFPFDTQVFEVKIIEIGNSTGDIQLVPDTVNGSGVSDKLSMPDWNIMSWKYDTASYSIMKGSALLPTLTFSFTAKRESGFYLLIFVIPLVLIIIMSMMAFWLTPKLSGSQISIATTSMLTLIAYRFVVSGSLPKISYMTRMDIFVLGSSILIFLTLLQSVFTATLSSNDKEDLSAKIDRQCRWIFPLLYITVTIVAFVL